MELLVDIADSNDGVLLFKQVHFPFADSFSCAVFLRVFILIFIPNLIVLPAND